ncbi:hypothetical protein AAC387_Pa05g3713 [Persea americana]
MSSTSSLISSVYFTALLCHTSYASYEEMPIVLHWIFISSADFLLLKSGILPLKVSLEDLYSGTTKKIGLSMKVKCSKCKGKGSVTISNDDRCPWCLGEKFVREKHVLQVAVEKGMQDGQKIMLLDEDRVVWDRSTGDTFSFLFRQEEHPTFKREGDDLFVEHTLSIIEALWGFEFILTHLDNRKLLIKSNPGEVVKPDQLKAINDEGMPMYGQPSMRGILYIHFSVDFSLSPAFYEAFDTFKPKSALPTEMERGKYEETTVHDVET